MCPFVSRAVGHRATAAFVHQAHYCFALVETGMDNVINRNQDFLVYDIK